MKLCNFESSFTFLEQYEVDDLSDEKIMFSEEAGFHLGLGKTA